VPQEALWQKKLPPESYLAAVEIYRRSDNNKDNGIKAVVNRSNIIKMGQQPNKAKKRVKFLS
jgi:hypothetical protein